MGSSPHPPYSPDIAPSDYYLFRSMAHGLADQQFRSYEDIENGLIRGQSQKMNTFTVTVFELYQKDGQNLQLTMGNTSNNSFVTIFSHEKFPFSLKNSGNVVAHLILLGKRSSWRIPRIASVAAIWLESRSVLEDKAN